MRKEMSPEIPVFTPDSLATSEDFDSLLRSLSEPGAGDLVHRHAAAIYEAPTPLVRGKTLFGPGEPHPDYSVHRQRMATVTTSVLRDVVYSPRSTSIHSLRFGFFEPSVRLIWPLGGPAALTRLEPLYGVNGDGKPVLLGDIGALER